MSEEQKFAGLRTLGIGKTLEVRVTNLEVQSDVHTSRLNSEDGTRSRMHGLLHQRLDDQDKRLMRIEKALYMAFGALGLLELILKIASK